MQYTLNFIQINTYPIGLRRKLVHLSDLHSPNAPPTFVSQGNHIWGNPLETIPNLYHR